MNQLKLARSAIAAKEFQEAKDRCESILETDANNYQALVFLGYSLSGLGNPKDALSTYRKATAISPELPLAWQGLLKVYESTGDLKLQLSVLGKLESINIKLNEKTKVWTGLLSQLKLAEELKDVNGICHILQKFLPDSPVYPFINDNDVRSPLDIWRTILNYQTAEFESRRTALIAQRRNRIDAPPLIELHKIVEKELLAQIPVDFFIERVLELEIDSEQLFLLQERYIQVAKVRLETMDQKSRPPYFERIQMVINNLMGSTIKSIPALTYYFEYENAELLKRKKEYLDFDHSDSNMSKIAQCYTWCILKEEQSQALESLLELAETKSDSVFVNQMLLNVYFNLQDWDNCIDTANKLCKMCIQLSELTSCDLSNVIREAKMLKAISLRHQSSTEVSMALTLLKEIMDTSPSNTFVMFHLGAAFNRLQMYTEAEEILKAALDIDGTYLEAKTELSWTLMLLDKYSEAQKILLDADAESDYYLIKFRLANLYWKMGGIYRSEKEYTHANLISAVMLNPTFSPSFTYLGHFYREQENDLLRAEKCYLKAMSIDPRDEDAARFLCDIYLLSEKIKEASDLATEFVQWSPRSFWGWNQAGILYLNDSQYEKAISYLQAALRISATFATWECLGEAYMKEGKFMAAVKAFDRALELNSESLTAHYLKVVVHSRLGMFQEAIESHNLIGNILSIKNASHNERLSFLKLRMETLQLYAADLHDQGCYRQCFTALNEALESALTAPDFDLKFPSLFKNVGDLFIMLYRLVPNLVTISESYKLLVSKLARAVPRVDNFDAIVNPQAFAVSCGRMFYQACILATNKATDSSYIYYHDYAKACFILHSLLGDQKLLNDAFIHIKLALQSNMNHLAVYNSLGIFTYKEDPKVSQHSFIRATQYEPTNPLPWVNLGYFYLLKEDIDLAGQCFKKAQFCNPEYSNAWLGQFMIAQILDSKDKYELIEHTYSLGRISQQELLFFYAHEVFERHDTTDLADAVFALAKIIESYSAGPHVYNLYGLLLEKQGLLGPALDAFDNCLAIVESESIREVVLENRARVLSSLGRFEDSMASWVKRLEYPVQDPFTYAGYGMTLYFNGNYQEAIKTYQKAIEMTKKDSTVNEITMGLCQVLFALGTPENIDLAKGYLLECFNRNNNFVKAIICLFTVGLKLQNWDLVQSAAIELEKLAPHISAPYAYEIESLLCKLYVLKGQTVKAKSSLLSSVYQSPTKSRWIRLALFLKKSDVDAQAYQKCWETSQSITGNVSSVLEMRSIDLQGIEAKVNVMKAIRKRPSSAENWLSLFLQSKETRAGGQIQKIIETLSPKSVNDSWGKLVQIDASISNGTADLNQLITQADAIITQSTSVQVKHVGYCILGRILEMAKNYEGAAKSFKTALLIGCNHTPLVMLMRMYAKLGLFDAAKACYLYAVNNNTEKLMIILEYVKLCMNANELQIASEIISEAIKLNPTDTRVLFLTSSLQGETPVL